MRPASSIFGRSWHIFSVVLLLAGAGAGLRAQSAPPGGSVSGVVTDATGAAIAGAQVTVMSPDRSVVRLAQTGADGGFAVRALRSGSYRVQITAPGFASWQNAAVPVAVGRNTQLQLELAPAHAAERITVHARRQALDTTQSAPATSIDKDRIEELPIPSRNYLNFTLLSPAVAPANPAVSRLTPGAESGGFSSSGLRPASNALYIDGSEDNDEYTGLSRTELSPEAISDFQIVQHGYQAEFGGSAGGSVDVETRSGSNLQHGDAFIFVQNGALNAIPPLERVPRRPDENRLRIGLSTGGRIEPGRLFYYVAGEEEMARGEEAGDFTPQFAASVESALRQGGPRRGFLLQQGFFPTVNGETELSGRLDRTVGANDLMLRYAMTNNRSVNDAFNTDDLTDLSARGSAFFSDNSVTGWWNHTFSPRLVNQLDAEVAQRRVALRTGATQGPGIVIAGLARFGTPWNGNSVRHETHFDLSDSVVRQRGRHLISAGLSLSRIGLRAADQQGFQGMYVFPSVAALANGDADFYAQSFGDPDTNFAELRSAAWAQDEWRLRHGLTLDYGLRWSDNRLPHPLPHHALNFEPRLGFAWSPGKQRWVVRGGFGIYDDRYLLSSVDRVEEFNGTRAEQQVAEGTQAAALYQSGADFTAPLSGIAPSRWQAQPHLANPFAQTASLGFERSLPSQWTLGAEYRWVHGVKLGRTLNVNLPPPVVLTAANAASLGILAPTPQQMGRPVFPLQRIDPAWDAVNQFETEASSSYNGATVTLNRQFTEEFELMAGYTWSKTIDDASYDTEQPQNPYAPRRERAPSLMDQRHRFVLSGLWVIGPDLDDQPSGAAAPKPNAVEKIVYGLEFAPIVEAGSGFRDDPLAGTDANREHVYPFAARPLGEARNSLRTPSQFHADLRILRMVPIWRGHLDIVAESFNLLNRQMVGRVNPVFGQSLSPTPEYGLPIQESDARRFQFSLDYEY